MSRKHFFCEGFWLEECCRSQCLVSCLNEIESIVYFWVQIGIAQVELAPYECHEARFGNLDAYVLAGLVSMVEQCA